MKLLQDRSSLSISCRIFWKKQSQILLAEYGFLKYAYTLPLAEETYSSPSFALFGSVEPVDIDLEVAQIPMFVGEAPDPSYLQIWSEVSTRFCPLIMREPVYES